MVEVVRLWLPSAEELTTGAARAEETAAEALEAMTGSAGIEEDWTAWEAGEATAWDVGEATTEATAGEEEMAEETATAGVEAALEELAGQLVT